MASHTADPYRAAAAAGGGAAGSAESGAYAAAWAAHAAAAAAGGGWGGAAMQPQSAQTVPATGAVPAAPKVKRVKVGNWERLFDDRYQTFYYTNVATGATQWDRPAEFPDLGPAPGQGGAAAAPAADPDADLVTKYIKIPMEAYQKELMKRPARVQIDHAEIKKFYIEGAQEYNIWYDRFMGDQWKQFDDKELSHTRCDMVKDCGKTKADQWDPEGTRQYFCIHFAKGRCSKGPECTFFHRIPTEKDAARFDNSFDVFGRERFQEHRRDMGGTGSFASDCCTLYVGGLGTDHDNVESALWRAFAEWGTPRKINIIHRLNIAFVTYNNRLNAEFAKQAMAGQALDGKEVLNMRFAYDDPNPKAKMEKLLDAQDTLLTHAERRGLLEESASKRVRLEPYEGKQVGYYPVKPSNSGSAAAIGPITPAQAEGKKHADSWLELDSILGKSDK